MIFYLCHNFFSFWDNFFPCSHLKNYVQTPSQETSHKLIFSSFVMYLFKSAHIKSKKCPSVTPEIVIFGFQQLSFAAAQQLWSDPVIEVWTSQPCLRCGGEVAKGIKLLYFFISQFMSAVSSGALSERFYVPSLISAFVCYCRKGASLKHSIYQLPQTALTSIS